MQNNVKDNFIFIYEKIRRYDIIYKKNKFSFSEKR